MPAAQETTLQREASEIIKRKDTMLLDENVRRWYENLSASSVHTEVALRRLDRFCDMNKTTPALLVSMPQKSLEDLVQDWKCAFEKQGYAPDYTVGIIKCLKSWLRHNERELKRVIKIRDQGVPVLLAYLTGRREAGEMLKESSPAICANAEYKKRMGREKRRRLLVHAEH